MSRYRWVTALLSLLLVTFLVSRAVYSVVNTSSTTNQISKLPIIIIDPGHGGIDGGAEGVGGIVEKNINLNISLLLRDMLVANGFEVVMTRDSDISIHSDGVNGTKSQKTSDLKNRLAITNEYSNAIFLSIHQNKFGQSSSRGTQVFFGSKSRSSEVLAQILQGAYVKALQPDNKRQIKKAGQNLFLVTNAKCPAVLIECGFVSNANEAKKLAESEYQAQIAFTTMCGLVEYLELDQPVGYNNAPSA